MVANVSRAGEIVISPGLAGDNGDALTASEADDGAGGTDCNTGTNTFVNGKWSEAEEVNHAGFDDQECTEISFVIDTSQAQANTTYRLILATKDNWRSDKGPWRGPVAIDQYATLTIESATTQRYAKDNTPKFTNCTDTDWGCESIDVTDDIGRLGTSIAISPEGVPWTAYRSETDGDLYVAEYVGSGGSGCDGGSSAWNCTLVETEASKALGSEANIAFAPDGAAWIKYSNNTDGRLRIARYVGSGGSCTSGAWNCTEISGGNFGTIAFDAAGNPWIGAYGGPFTAFVRVIHYVGNGAGDCAFDADWVCETIDTGSSIGFGTSAALAFDASGTPWLSYHDADATALKVAHYVGSGGSCANDTAWECETVDNTGSNTGDDTSIVIDGLGNPWVSYYDEGNGDLRVATRGGGYGSTCTDSDWTCGAVDSTDDVGQHTSIAIDATGDPSLENR